MAEKQGLLVFCLFFSRFGRQPNSYFFGANSPSTSKAVIGSVEIDVVSFDGAAGVFDPPIPVAGNIHNGSDGVARGVGGECSGAGHGSRCRSPYVLETEAEGAGFLVGNKKKTLITTATTAVAIGGGFYLNRNGNHAFGRVDRAGDVKRNGVEHPNKQ